MLSFDFQERLTASEALKLIEEKERLEKERLEKERLEKELKGKERKNSATGEEENEDGNE